MAKGEGTQGQGAEGFEMNTEDKPKISLRVRSWLFRTLGICFHKRSSWRYGGVYLGTVYQTSVCKFCSKQWQHRIGVATDTNVISNQTVPPRSPVPLPARDLLPVETGGDDGSEIGPVGQPDLEDGENPSSKTTSGSDVSPHPQPNSLGLDVDSPLGLADAAQQLHPKA